MDAVEAGHSFTVTRDGRPMGELVPLRRRFVTRAQFTQSSANASVPDLELLRRDTDEQLITGPDDPYAR
jgi:antitoxin (DNA-binding transcriptional repressor) of toxin-antitoxin stability system